MPASPVFTDGGSARPPAPTVIVQTQSGGWRSWALRFAMFALAISVLVNMGMYAAYRDYFANVDPPIERFHSGEETASEKIVILTMSGTIMPPYTERLIKQIEQAEKADAVKGVLLAVDSPGGFVADSHQIYHALQKLTKKKPVYVQMKRMAASGGYYISMGAGPQAKIFAEPTTWTGSIGVIIPRYDVSGLAEKFGVSSDPLKTGEFKDALSPFRPLTENERKLWENILNQSFEQFMSVIDENRDTLDAAKVKTLATGQIYTAQDAVENGLVDQIGFEEDALAALQSKVGLSKARVVTYEHPAGLLDLLSMSSKAQATNPWRVMLEASVPQALFYASWFPPLPE
ncbi:MAG TPA: signal peptide peptidase SppA [Planctomycetaceae bacterium]|nr:signal peptide peptidase SppA [Planctomycetaceae bacterium]